MLPLALGTQTGGSVIRPAAFCGTVGLKPSFGLLPTVGMKCFSWTLDTIGLFSAGVADAAHALALMTGRPDLNLSPGEPSSPRFGLLIPDFCEAPEPEAHAALMRAAGAIVRVGAQLRALDLPRLYGNAFAMHGTIQDYEGKQALAWEYASCREELPPMLRAQLDAAQGIEPEAYDAAQDVAEQARRAFADLLRDHDVDVILTLSAPGYAPTGYGSTGDSRFNRLWTLLGVPCVTVPVSHAGIPLGVQIIGARGEDSRTLAAAHYVERALQT